jgi:hypothetical protein
METSEPMAVYPPTDWTSDYEWFCQETSKYPPHSASMGIEAFEKHFYATRKNPEVARHCMDRFAAAMAYLNDNSKEILVDNLGVSGDDTSLVCSSVVFTLYRFYVGRPDLHIEMDIPVEVFLEEARKDRKNRPK